MDILNRHFDGQVKLVQIGQTEHDHLPLRGVIDFRGKTNDQRRFFRVIEKAEGVLTSVSFPMHVAAALKKPAVVVAGGREGTRWELYPHHRFLYMNGAIPCASYDGCWKSVLEPQPKHPDRQPCVRPVHALMPDGMDSVKVPLCMEMTTPQMIVDAVMLYYRGGVLEGNFALQEQA